MDSNITPIRPRKRNGRPQTPTAEAARLRRLAAAWSEYDTSELLAQADQVEAAARQTRAA